jgi:hypothetical protein
MASPDGFSSKVREAAASRGFPPAAAEIQHPFSTGERSNMGAVDPDRVCIYFAADYLGIRASDLKWHPTFDSRDHTIARWVIGPPRSLRLQ